ncbi:4-alpha-glucanotransferase [bacterium]|nr:4-alpha-glucanotransferase [bacterium]
MGLIEKKPEKVLKDALKVLNKKQLSLIIHGSSFPDIEGEDTAYGTYNSNGAKSLIDYISGLFTSVQLGPNGKLKSCDSSPYTSTIFSGNPLFIDLKQLTTEEWDGILSKETFNSIVEENPNKNVNKTAFSYAYRRHDDALNEAYNNFVKSEALKKRRKQFEIYKHENASWLDKDALYQALSVEHGNDYWPLWKSETDKNLCNPKSIEQRMEYADRIQEIEDKYTREIDFYKFCQFVLSYQSEETKKYADKKKIKMIADRQVAFSDRDIWAYQQYFLDGWMLGCPPDYFSADGQAWGFPVMNPEFMYNEDGSLGEGGKLMKELFKKMFRENKGGVRIDHIVGLIDPWVYKAGAKPKIEEGAGRLYSSPEHEFLKKFAVITEDNLNLEVEADKEQRVQNLTKAQVKAYGRLIEKIVIAAAKEEGLSKNSIVCEDLGTLTNPVAAVLKEYGLLGMRLTQFVVPEKEEHPYRCKNITEKCWAMVGTHDNKPISMWADSLVNTHEAYLHAKALVEDMFADADNKDDIIVKLTQDAEFLAKIKLVEIFASQAENIQIFFTDYFNVKDVYNVPGTSGDVNWSLRLPNDFKSLNAIDLPEILKMAIEARGKDFADKHRKLIDKLNNI